MIWSVLRCVWQIDLPPEQLPVPVSALTVKCRGSNLQTGDLRSHASSARRAHPLLAALTWVNSLAGNDRALIHGSDARNSRIPWGAEQFIADTSRKDSDGKTNSAVALTGD